MIESTRSHIKLLSISCADVFEAVISGQLESAVRGYLKMSSALVVAISCSLLGAVNFGLIITYSAQAIPSMESSTSAVILKPHEEYSSWIVSAPALSAIFSAFIALPMAASFGRRYTLHSISLVCAIGWWTIGLAKTKQMILIGRLITGVALAFYSGIAPIFIAEVSPTNIRGSMGTLFHAFVAIGGLMTATVGAFFNWNQTALINSIPSILIVFLMFAVPESPIFLYNKHGGHEITVNALKRLRSAGDDLKAELNQIGDSLSVFSDQPFLISARQLLQRNVYQPLIISIFLMMFQQLTGMNVIVFNEIKILINADVRLNLNLCLILLISIGAVSSLLAASICDRLGRRKLLIASGMIE